MFVRVASVLYVHFFSVVNTGILSKIKLNSRKIAAPYYEDTRTAMIRHIQMVDGLYDLAVDFAEKADGSVPWGALTTSCHLSPKPSQDDNCTPTSSTCLRRLTRNDNTGTVPKTGHRHRP